jgi:hypothetical protein
MLEKIKNKITQLIPEALGKIRYFAINERSDRIRVIFEFEFKNGEIHDAVEVRWRRPWE